MLNKLNGMLRSALDKMAKSMLNNGIIRHVHLYVMVED